MAELRPETRAHLSSDGIEQINFRTALRGYDTQQVRDYLRSVADHVRGLHRQIDALTLELAEAVRRAENPVLDESTLAAALGGETARILQSAHEAAADIRGRAEEHVERVVQQAREDGARLTNEAANILEVRRTAAEAEAAEILRAANEEARRVTEESTAKAKALLAEAEEQAQAAVEGAKAERAEVLSDVRRRRRVANTQIEQLRAGRERLLQAYEVVRSTLEQVTNELDVADVEAKAAAEEVGRRMNAAIDPLRADSLASTPLVDLPAEPPAPVDPPKSADAPKTADAPRSADAPRIAVVEAPKSEPVAADAPPSRPHRKKGKGARPPVAVVTPITGSDRAPEPEPAPADEPVVAPVVAAKPPRQQQPDHAPAPEPASEAADEPVAAPLVAAESPPPQQQSDRAPEAAPEPADAPVVPVVAAEPPPPQEQPESVSEPEPVVAEDSRAAQRVAARNETCTALEAHLARRVKRALQDEQNVVLDRLRSVRGTLNADAALGAEAEHVTTYVNIVEPALADAARAGAAATGNPIDVPAEFIAAVANDFADELVLPLRRQLDERLHESAAVGDDRITASDRVSAAYREAKTHRAARLASEWLIAAWAVGVYAATATGASGEWLSDPAKPCCTDCDDNGLAGGVAKGAPFPTGHLHPPAHPGCRCVVVPTQ